MLCNELLDRYPNLYLDITPGWEMFENFAKDREYWRNFFGRHSRRILFGTDTFSDHWMETVTCLQRVMETDETFVAFEENWTCRKSPCGMCTTITILTSAGLWTGRSMCP